MKVDNHPIGFIWKCLYRFILGALCLCSCGTHSQAGTAPHKGVAAYYSHRLHGCLTSSGRPYDRNRLTAAHHHLPFGSKVRVTHLQNGRSVDVVINDRMRHPQRVIDLSYAAAYRLGMIEQGGAPV